MPAQPDEQAAVVAVVGGPPVLGGGQHRDHVGLEGLDVELGELRGVVEVLAERVCQGCLRVQLGYVDLVRPPVPVRQGSTRLGSGASITGFSLLLTTFLSGVGKSGCDHGV